MLRNVLNDVEQDSAFGNLSSVPVQSLLQVRLGHSADSPLGVRVGSLERGDNFCFVGGGLLQGFRINPRRHRSADEPVKIVVGSAGVQENFGNGANICGGTPCVFVSRAGLGQAHEFACLQSD